MMQISLIALTRRNFWIQFNDGSKYFGLANYSWWRSSNEKKYELKVENLMKTEMLIQDNSNIYELPIVIEKNFDFESVLNKECSSNDFKSASTKTKPASNLNEDLPNSSNTGVSDDDNKSALQSLDLKLFKNLGIEKFFKKTETNSTFNKYNPLAESFIHNEISSRVAIQSLKKIINLERKNHKSKRPGKLTQLYSNRHNCISQLIDVISRSQDSQIVIEALAILLRDKFNPLNNVYKDVLTNEALIRATRGDLSIQQLIDCCKILFAFRDFKCKEAIDYFWIGFVTKQSDISPKQTVSVFRLLKHFKKSRPRIQLLLERKLLENHKKLSVHQITELMNISQNLSLSPAVIECIGQWTNSHLGAVSKYDLLEFIEGLTSAKYVSLGIEKTVEKIVSSKTMNCNDHALVAALAVYCSTTRLRNAAILNKIVRYFEKFGRNFSLSSVASVTEALGELNFKPEARGIFWTNFEKTLIDRFREFKPDEVLNILVSCAYVGKYFPQLASSVFSWEFLERVDSQSDVKKIQLSRSQLCLLDTAMSIECGDSYGGPLLHRPLCDADPASVGERKANSLREFRSQLIALAGGSDKLSQHVTLSVFSKSPLYRIDALIHGDGKPAAPRDQLALDLDPRKGLSSLRSCTAVLLLLPEDYCWNSSELVGRTAMKVRLLRNLGFKLMLLDYEALRALRAGGGPAQVADYLGHRFEMAQGQRDPAAKTA